ncbi:MAG: hypothetical protein DHS20C01_14300 [marine bacterium B5-7]|nr:MAG: hypothetical protein DHS20C01_14300 [marine bacterium B5-7]
MSEILKSLSIGLFAQTIIGLSIVFLLVANSHGQEASHAIFTSPGASEPNMVLVTDVDCCSCRTAQFKTFDASEIMPCDFDLPSHWKTLAGDDGATVNAVAGAECGAACPISPGMAFSVARKHNTNADTMEQIWPNVMRIAGSANCGGAAVTFFSLPGSDPGGLSGGLRFHVGFNGQRYGANVTFTCAEPGEWLQLQELFINSFRTNENSTFDGK